MEKADKMLIENGATAEATPSVETMPKLWMN